MQRSHADALSSTKDLQRQLHQVTTQLQLYTSQLKREQNSTGAQTAQNSIAVQREQQSTLELAHVGAVNGGCKSLAKTKGITLLQTPQLVAPVVVIAYNRAHYLTRAMASILK